MKRLIIAGLIASSFSSFLFSTSVDSIEDMFKKSKVKSRFRVNTFVWKWDHEDQNHKDNKAMGVGGSINLKTASYKGISLGFGFYTSQNPGWFRESRDDVKYLKAGKDTLSRYKVLKTGEYGLTVLAKSYIEFSKDELCVRVGRFGFNSVFTAENNSKMVPNTFEGAFVQKKFSKDFRFRFAYITRQKLRDHESFHDVITFKNAEGESWANNDDSAVHKGLSYQNFVKHHKDPDHTMLVSDVNYKFNNFSFTLSALSVPDVLKDYAFEGSYKYDLKNGWALKPAFRYILQKDDGGGEIAGYTNLSGKEAIGYDPSVKDSLDSSLIAARMDLLFPKKKGFFRLAYSKVEDKADIVAPWRGFPTGGYTRAMGQYNWYANTKTTMARVVYKFENDLSASLRYAIEDFDEKKIYVQADTKVINLDVVKKLSKKFFVKFRIAKSDMDTKLEKDYSHLDTRLEFNYLF